jgi:hypothetical protein
MRVLGFDANDCVIPADEPGMVHHYRTVRRVHPNGNKVRVVLDTTPGKPGEIIELSWTVFNRCVVKADEVKM